jgi:spermidine synthase
VLVPHLGLVRSALLFGLINVGVAVWTTRLLRAALPRRGWLQAASVAVLALLVAGWLAADRILEIGESNLYADDVVLARNTPYQRIVLTAWKDDLRLFLNSHLQFSSKDEYRYHEALVHPGLSAQPEARRVLVLGGGDGLAVREILKHPRIEHVTLVDLDPEMTRLFSTHPELTKLNHGAFADPRVHCRERGLPSRGSKRRTTSTTSPSWTSRIRRTTRSASSTRPRSTARWRATCRPTADSSCRARRRCFARKSFWCVVQTVEATRLEASPYHVYVPAFGEWGFVIGGRTPYRQPATLPSDLRFLTLDTLPELFTFPPDMQRVPVEPNHLNTQVLVRYYEQEWDGSIADAIEVQSWKC